MEFTINVREKSIIFLYPKRVPKNFLIKSVKKNNRTQKKKKPQNGKKQKEKKKKKTAQLGFI